LSNDDPLAVAAAAEATTETALVGVFRSEAGRIVATLTRLLGDIDLAEDAVQEALATALERWPRDGTPDRPGAWLMTTARNKALDHLRRERTRATAREAALRLHIDDEGDPTSALDSTVAVGCTVVGSLPISVDVPISQHLHSLLKRKSSVC